MNLYVSTVVWAGDAIAANPAAKRRMMFIAFFMVVVVCVWCVVDALTGAGIYLNPIGNRAMNPWMVNTCIMNIDVREYLRTNPISVHESTLSGDGRDCFLYFPKNPDGTGFVVFTQDDIFLSLYKSIFRNLVKDGSGDVAFNIDGVEVGESGAVSVRWPDAVRLSDGQFANHVRRSVWESDREEFERAVSGIASQVEGRIGGLSGNSALDYPGTVEIQSSLTKLLGDGSPHIYANFPCASGFMWCFKQGHDVQDGVDDALVGDVPPKHAHPNASAEATTRPFGVNRGGGRSMGRFTVGRRDMVSQDATYGPTAGTSFGAPELAPTLDGQPTFPLSGQNILGFRDKARTHNNIPPCTNVHVRYGKWLEEAGRGTPRAAQAESEELAWNPAEVQHRSLRVPELDEFTVDDLTGKDCMLRMTLDEETGEAKLMRQDIQTFLGIFSDDAGRRLSMDIGETNIPLGKLLAPKLDSELVPRREYMSWHAKKLAQMEALSARIAELEDMLGARKPAVYAGRVVISTTDATERDVVAHYGGKRWRRIENFLRGVDAESAEEERGFGQKLGEEHVCLRSSNIPIHAHGGTLKTASDTGPASWIESGRSGRETQVVNSESPSTVDSATDVRNVGVEYQLGPLGCVHGTTVAMPHDNMPPHREVYIWECVEATDSEMQASGEPDEGFCEVVWDANGGVMEAESPFQFVGKGESILVGRTAISREGHEFHGWMEAATGAVWFGADGSKEVDDTSILGKTVLTAMWTPREVTVTFDSQGGSFPCTGCGTINIRKYLYGQRLGALPTPICCADGWGEETKFDAWLDEGGGRICPDTLALGDATYRASYSGFVHYRNINGVEMPSLGTFTDFKCGDEEHPDKRCLMTERRLAFDQDWEIVVKVVTGEDVSTNQEIFATDSGANMEFGVIRESEENGGRNRFGWELATGWTGPGSPQGGDGGICGEHVIVLPNTEYTVKVQHISLGSDLHRFVCSVLEPGSDTWTVDMDRTRELHIGDGSIVFGADEDNPLEWWRGSIVLSESHITVAGCRYMFKLEQEA